MFTLIQAESGNSLQSVTRMDVQLNSLLFVIVKRGCTRKGAFRNRNYCDFSQWRAHLLWASEITKCHTISCNVYLFFFQGKLHIQHVWMALSWWVVKRFQMLPSSDSSILGFFLTVLKTIAQHCSFLQHGIMCSSPVYLFYPFPSCLWKNYYIIPFSLYVQHAGRHTALIKTPWSSPLSKFNGIFLGPLRTYYVLLKSIQ